MKRTAGRGLLLAALATFAIGALAGEADGAASRAVTLQQLIDLNPGLGSGVTAISNALVYNNMLLFFGNDGTNGQELWKTDGTAAGTQMVSNINPGAASSNPSQLTLVGNTLFFTANDGTNGTELWKTDGTAAGTQMVSNINPTGSSFPSQLTPMGNTLFFTANNGTDGTELWRSDGTGADTLMVSNINPGAASSNPSIVSFYNNGVSSKYYNGSLYFWADDGVHGREIWRSDGTFAGTVFLGDLNSGVGNSSMFGPGYVFNGRPTFFANCPPTGNGLFGTDGTAAGTTLLHQFNTDFPFFASIPQQQTYQGSPVWAPFWNSQMFFTANDGLTGMELWKTDGTVAGTQLVNDINPGLPGSFPGSYFFPLGGNLVFPADNATYGNEWWVSNGTSAGTSLLKDINPAPNTGSNPSPLSIHQSPYDRTPILGNYVIGGNLFFAANDGATGEELWRTDGTAGGTVQVADFNLGLLGSSPGDLFLGRSTGVDLLVKTFSTSATGADGRELWSFSGSTVSHADINSGGGDSNPSGFFFGGDTLFFNANNGTSGVELFKTDGTAAGTTLIQEMNTNAAPNNDSNPSVIVSSDRPLLQGGLNGFGSGREFWNTDGTAAGTTQLADLETGTGSPMLNGQKKALGRLFLAIQNAASGSELYTVNMADLANPPQIVSSLNQGGTVGTPFTYQTEVLSSLWPVTVTATGLPPGLTFDSSLWTITGTPTASGSYSVALVADNGAGADNKTLKITIPGGGVSASDVDSDEDGFPDEIEEAWGTDPKDPNSTPFGGSKAGAPQPFTVDKLGIKLDFHKANNDAIGLSGTVPVGTDVKFTEQKFTVDIGGLVRIFTLDVKGKSPKGKDVVIVGKPGKNGSARYNVKFTKGALASKLEDEGLTNDDLKAQDKNVPVIVLFMSKLYSKVQPQVYTAIKNKGGKTAMPKKK